MRCQKRVLAWTAVTALFAISALSTSKAAEARDAAFATWLSTLRQEAVAEGIRTGTFDRAMADITLDLKLPDLVLPGQSQKQRRSNRGQAEFTRPPQAYLNKRQLARLAKRGRALARRHRTTLSQIEQRLQVPRDVVLAIWGRETAFGGYRLKHDAIRVLTTQAYTGRRKDMFRDELLAALKMLDEGVPRGKMRSSWAGAVGLTQFMPTEYFSTAFDLTGDGRKDLWAVPDA